VSTNTPPLEARPVLDLADVTISVQDGTIHAVRGVSLQVRRSSSVGLVGESGSGKTLTCRAALGILAPGCRVESGTISFGGTDVSGLDPRQWRAIHGRRVGAVFQDPGSYLNPSVPVGRQVTEAVHAATGLGRRAARVRALELLTLVGLRGSEHVYRQIPGELSGGMLQRVLIAIAIAGDPELLVADEATTALDVTVQAEIIELLRRLRDERGLGILFVSHDLGVIAELCDHVVVFYAGEVVETGPVEEILRRPRHPYTQAMLRVASLGDYRRRELEVIPGQPPSVGERIAGCRFAARCAYAADECRSEAIELVGIGDQHDVRCARIEQIDLLQSDAWQKESA
jgi:peptide/nickel transport system ATP-binding protein